MHNDELGMRRCSCFAISYFANVSRFSQARYEIVIDKLKSLRELGFVKSRKDLLNHFRFLLSTQTIYLLICKERAQSNDDCLSDCRYRRDLFPK